MGNVGIPELIFIFLLALLLFGPKKLPELGRTIGRALTEFRKASTDFQMAIQDEVRELERHGRELEAKAQETLKAAEAAAGLSEEPIGAGSIDPHPAAAPEAAAAQPANLTPAAEDSHPEQLPPEGDPKRG